MAKYCVTAANHNNPKDNRASEFQLWENVHGENGKSVWSLLGKKSANFVTQLIIEGHTVLSGEEFPDKIVSGYPIEIELRIAKNDKNFKITDFPTFK